MTDPIDPTDPTEPTEPTEPTAPVIATGTDDRVAVLAAYFRSNAGRFTDEALGMAAEGAGYSTTEIDSARSLALGQWKAGGATPRRTNRAEVAAVAIGYVVGLYALIAVFGSLSANSSGIIVVVGLLAGIVAWVLLRDERPSLAQGIGCGVVLAITIPIVVILVLLGICLVAGSGQVIS